MQFSIKTNFPDVQRQLDQLQADIAGPATARALNRTIEPAQGDMAREISREFNVTSAKARESMRITKARFYKGQLSMSVSLESDSRKGRSLNLISFVERSVSMAAARRRMAAGEGGAYKLRNGATVVKQLELRFKVKRTGPKQIIKGAFIANDGRTVFQREGKERLPIKALQTVGIAQMFNTKRLNERVVARLFERFPKNFQHEVRYYTDRFNARRVTA